MVSEVRKVLNSCIISSKVYDRLDAAERADAAKREEPVQALRRKVAELVARWTKRLMPLQAVGTVRELLDELNAIIATKPDTVENRQATASGPVMHESVWCDGKNVTPADGAKERMWREIKPEERERAIAEEATRIRAIAAEAVRDAMPDVLEKVADPLESDREFRFIADLLQNHAAKLRKERGA